MFSSSPTKNLHWWVPKVPSIISMVVRCGALMLITIFYWAITLILIQGEDVFWKFNVVDLWYSRAGTNPQDVWTFVAIGGYGLIWGIGMFWVVGFFDRWFS